MLIRPPRSMDYRSGGESCLDGSGEGMVRSRTLSLILLSTSHLIEEDVQAGVGTGLRAPATSGTVGSARVRDRFRPLAAHARKHRNHAGARDLAERIGAATASAAPPMS